MTKKIPTRRLSAPLLVGAFLVFGMGLFVGLIVWLGATRFFGDFDRYVTYFNVSIEGLEAGRPVKYQGVPVGNIERIALAPDGKLIEIVMLIDKKMNVDAKLRIKQEIVSIAGGKFLQLYFPAEASRELEDHPELTFEPEFPLILSAPSRIEEIGRAMSEAANRLLDIDTKTISYELVEALRAVRQLSDDPAFRRVFVSADTLVSDVSGTLSHVNQLLARLDTSGIIDQAKMTVDFSTQAAIGMKMTVDSLAMQINALRLAARADSLTLRYNQVADDAQATLQQLSARVNQTLLATDEAVRQLTNTTRQLRRISSGFADDIGERLLGEPEPKKEQ